MSLKIRIVRATGLVSMVVGLAVAGSGCSDRPRHETGDGSVPTDTASGSGGSIATGSGGSIATGSGGSVATGSGGTIATGSGGASTDVPPDPDAITPPPFNCGNSVLDSGETCDDGNAVPGDGCSGLCQLEPFHVCPIVGQPCMSTIVCGNSILEGNETCDDGNTVGGDGCTPTCQKVVNWNCPTVGMPCVPVPTSTCGNGTLDTGEGCDDGNATSGDGCSSICQLEPDHICPTPGSPCIVPTFCGDGKLNGTEECDDGNMASGDGCSGGCRIEPFHVCPTPGQLCPSTIVCGDSKIVGDEACDDGNMIAGDGCSADCKQVEPGFVCPANNGNGGACTAVTVPKCGDGRLDAAEYCDDGNILDGDGCTATCVIEPGYTCPTAGMKCMAIALCGDGKLTVSSGEQCDDGNTAGGDGCTTKCQLEADWVCETPGQPCVSTIKCGDHRVSGNEQCDDGNTGGGDGCSATCQVECGWICPPNSTCRAMTCGDGIVAGNEQCDDGNNAAGDGCDPNCTLEGKPITGAEGWNCSTPTQVNGCVGPTTCATTMCGNGMREGSEQCDDGNSNTGDGCSPHCRLEPVCPASGGACATACGDGLLLPVDKANGQECDDGNTVSGDGCSSTCKVEPGFTCTDTVVRPNPLILPIVYHDFRGWDETSGANNRHPDFEHYTGDGQAGIAQNRLSTTNGGVPVHAPMCVNLTTNLCAGLGADPNVDWFGMWYLDNATYNRPLVRTLTLPQLNNMVGVYQFDSNAFFPIDGVGFGNAGRNHNFGFTSAVRYWFEYNGTATLDFIGDDDVWVFINKRLAVDLGGLHTRQEGSVVLNATDGTGHVCDFVANCNNGGAGHTVDLGLQLGGVYEIVVFQAERHTTESNYRLTLSNFSGKRSSCVPVCGDGVQTRGEACDLGTAQNTGAYGGCNADCTLAPSCGDSKVQSNEQCDNGVNLTTYGGTAKVCGPGCKWAAYCGDTNIDSSHGEQCDDGANNGKGYGFCTANCQLGPRCGDGVTTNGEQCDSGAKNGTAGDKCQSDCKLKCGNGTLEAGEQCDNGAANNTGGYGKCNSNCTLGARCGDGIKNGTEQCDDGKNDGSYGNCAPGCVLGPRCGDSVTQTTAGETCDNGASNVAPATAYGKNICTTRCLGAPYCGNRSVDTAFGEGCDDGVNSGMPGSCTVDCKSYVPLASCGNGVKDPGEQCDDGASNGTMTSTCNVHCKFKCGDGIKDVGEQCDDGVNSGAYGTCNGNCTLAPYCGDGTKNGNEQCDLGASNADGTYGPNTCTKLCKTGPYCGDGRIQSANGEQCDSGPGCGTDCKNEVVP